MGQQSILITGAASGIGLASTRCLHAAGFHIIAGHLPDEDTTSLRAISEDDISLLPIDITRPEHIFQAKQRITQNDWSLYGLFNNAGIAISGPVEFTPMEAIRRQLDVNLLGHVAMTQAMLPLIRATRGRVVNTTSILGRIALGFSAPYCMSKFAMEAFTDSLRLEMKPYGVQVAAIEPGVIKTNIWNNLEENIGEIVDELPPEGQQLYGNDLQVFIATTRRESAQGISPDHVAKAVHHAFTARRPRTRYLVGTDARLVALLKRWLPDRLFDRIMMARYPTSGG